MPRHRTALLLFVLLPLLLPCAGRLARIGAAGEEPTEKAFLAGLERARTLLAAGKAAEGLKATTDLLTLHQGRDWVRAKRADLEDLAKRLTFGVQHPPPLPKDVVKGRLVSYTSNPCRIKLVGTPGHHDFESDRGLFTFPAPFTGPHTIEISGPSYPRTTDASPRVVVCLGSNSETDQRRSWSVYPGIPPYDSGANSVWLPSRIVLHEGQNATTLAEKETSQAKAGAPFKLEVKVQSTRISGEINNKVFGTAQKPDDAFGYLAFECPAWTEVVVSGAIEPSWIQGKIDAAVQASMQWFERTFDVKKVLPAWLYEEGSTPAPASTTDEEDDYLPTPVEPKHRARVLAVMGHIRRERHAQALAEIEGLGADGAPEALCRFLSAEARMEMGDAKGALVDLDQGLVLVPTHAATHLMRGVVLHRLGRDAEAVTAFRASVSAGLKRESMVRAAVLYMLRAGATDGAKAAIEDAARRGLRSKSLDALGRVLVKVSRGPDWPKTFESKTANYRVLSDIDVDICRQAAQVLEEALIAFKAHMGPLDKASARQFNVFLFSGQAGFGKYMEDIGPLSSGGHENAAGLYSPLLKQLLIWNLPSREEMFVTIRHEGFHQYLDRLLPEAPTWFNEGLAVYYENMDRVGAQFRHGNLHGEHLQALEAKGLYPLAEFLFQPHGAFYEDPDRTYAQAWLLIHMLRHGTSAQKALFKDLLAHLKTDSAYDAQRAVFTPEVIARLDTELAAYLASGAKAK